MSLLNAFIYYISKGYNYCAQVYPTINGFRHTATTACDKYVEYKNINKMAASPHSKRVLEHKKQPKSAIPEPFSFINLFKSNPNTMSPEFTSGTTNVNKDNPVTSMNPAIAPHEEKSNSDGDFVMVPLNKQLKNIEEDFVMVPPVKSLRNIEEDFVMVPPDKPLRNTENDFALIPKELTKALDHQGFEGAPAKRKYLKSIHKIFKYINV
ncbi:hypothetical protein BDC45DRAFT_567893 [Circinella umbellata]|nr:hypothetical protein BDC45DRAFT_567893 [Circinella umbellata]